MRLVNIPASIFAVLLLTTYASYAAAAKVDRQYLGAFSNVQISKMSGDCDGVSVQLWVDKQGTDKPVISGIFYDASGECPGNKSTIAAATFDQASGKLDFTATNPETGVVTAEFRGMLDAKSLHGRFGYGNGNTGKVDSWTDIRLRHLSGKAWKRVGE